MALKNWNEKNLVSSATGGDKCSKRSISLLKWSRNTFLVLSISKLSVLEEINRRPVGFGKPVFRLIGGPKKGENSAEVSTWNPYFSILHAPLMVLFLHISTTIPLLLTPLSNIWWMPNSVSKGFDTALKTGSIKTIQTMPHNLHVSVNLTSL